MKWRILTCMFLAYLAASPAPAATVKEVQGEKGEPQVVMENPTWKLTILPALGGRISHLVLKETGHDWHRPDCGMFLDHVTQQPWPGELLKAPYTCKIVKADDKGVSPEWHEVKRRVSCPGGGFRA